MGALFRVTIFLFLVLACLQIFSQGHVPEFTQIPLQIFPQESPIVDLTREQLQQR